MLTNKTNWLFRRATAKFRQLPNCYIIGAQKAGTSSLYYYLTQHPQINKSFIKEVHYFDGGLNPNINTINKGENWYKAHFSLKKFSSSTSINIDATPLYLFNPIVAPEIQKYTPNAKFIILLRDPVERAISHYFHVKRHGFEPLVIEEALIQEDQRLAPCYLQNNFKDPAFRLYSYKARGLYLRQIKNFLNYFDENQILILHSDDLFTTPSQTIKKVLTFLGVDDNFKTPNISSQNVAKNKEAVSKETRQYLQHFFKEPNQALFDFLNINYKWQ